MNTMYTKHLQKYRNNNQLELYISSYLAGNKSKDLYNKINELLYNSYKNIKLLKTNIKI